MVGRKFGLLTVLGRSERGGSYWDCLCSCGSLKQVRSDHLKGEKVHSCGCQKGALISKKRARHGHARTDGQSPTYNSWIAMRNRCNNPNHQSFPFYGARGIRVCESWMTSFETFLSDMGVRPDGMTLDRIDNDGHYEPSNCRWSEQPEQMQNQRHRVYVEHNGEKLLLTEAAKRMGIQENTLRMRLRRQAT